jgi:hypothetical protein
VTLKSNRVVIECLAGGDVGGAHQSHISLQRVGYLILGYSEGLKEQEGF